MFRIVRRTFAIFLFAALSVMAGIGAAGVLRGEEKGFISVNPPRSMPAFVFEDEKGKTLDLKDFRGRYVLLNLWSTSCPPCIAEMPALNALSKKLDNKKFAVVALSEDINGAVAARSFFQRHSIDSLAVYADTTGRAPFVLNMRGLPTTVLIDPKGAEIARLEGPVDWSKESVRSYLEAQP